MKKTILMLCLLSLVGCVSKPLTDIEYQAQQNAEQTKEAISLRQEQAECTYTSKC